EPAPKHQLPQVGVGVDELPPGRDLREERGQGTALQVSPAGQVDRRSVPLGQLQQPLTGDQGRGQLNEGLEIAEMRRTKLLTESFLAPAVSVQLGLAAASGCVSPRALSEYLGVSVTDLLLNLRLDLL